MLEHNPFMNLTWEVTSGERVKCALLGPLLMPPRILLLVTCVFTAYFWGRLSCIGGVDLNKPLPYWRIVVRGSLDGLSDVRCFGLGTAISPPPHNTAAEAHEALRAGHHAGARLPPHQGTPKRRHKHMDRPTERNVADCNTVIIPQNRSRARRPAPTRRPSS